MDSQKTVSDSLAALAITYELKKILIFSLIFFSIPTLVGAQNPLIRDQFTADPSARVFDGRVYIYPSHDILATPGHGRIGWFCMADYHVFSSADLTDWKDHGVLLSQNKVAWADSTAYSMWAPDCIDRNGKYYLYFPTIAKAGTINGKGFTVGVAVAQHPYGPFVPQAEPIKGVHGIDPNVFIDEDGQAYLYWAQGNIYAAKLKNNMLELASEPVILGVLPDKGLKEGPYLFKRKGIYYLTYPHVAEKTERLEYAISESPLGPFRFGGIIMDESASGCWTNHQSVIEFKKQWYLFYHDDQLSPNFDKNRSIRADSLFFNSDGTIRKVVPTLRGIGISSSSAEIQIDRYSSISNNGVSVDFIDTANLMKGWKTTMSQKNGWVRYNRVQFNPRSQRTVTARVNSTKNNLVEIRLDRLDGPIIARISIKAIEGWHVDTATLQHKVAGVHDLFIILKTPDPLAVDWIKFK